MIMSRSVTNYITIERRVDDKLVIGHNWLVSGENKNKNVDDITLARMKHYDKFP
jgi:hypothetical protein